MEDFITQVLPLVLIGMMGLVIICQLFIWLYELIDTIDSRLSRDKKPFYINPERRKLEKRLIELMIEHADDKKDNVYYRNREQTILSIIEALKTFKS